MAETVVSVQAVETAGETVVLKVRGDIDMASRDSFHRSLFEQCSAASGCLVVVDLSEVGFMGSVGVAGLVEAKARCAERGCTLRVLVVDNRPVLRLLELASLMAPLDVHTDPSEITGG